MIMHRISGIYRISPTIIPLQHHANAKLLDESIAPGLERTAVMKHLDVLEDAGLIRVEREGRSRWNHLPEKPLTGMVTWLQRRVLTHQGNLQRLKKLTESKGTRNRN
tara:strand:- start:1388 stop:1708 length:321 start_codon:yes stop_codon:yes gene_type:complete